MALTDPQPDFQGHSIFEVEYLKNGASNGQSYCRIVIGIHGIHSLSNGTTFSDVK